MGCAVAILFISEPYIRYLIKNLIEIFLLCRFRENKCVVNVFVYRYRFGLFRHRVGRIGHQLTTFHHNTQYFANWNVREDIFIIETGNIYEINNNTLIYLLDGFINRFCANLFAKAPTWNHLKTFSAAKFKLKFSCHGNAT